MESTDRGMLGTPGCLFGPGTYKETRERCFSTKLLVPRSGKHALDFCLHRLFSKYFLPSALQTLLLSFFWGGGVSAHRQGGVLHIAFQIPCLTESQPPGFGDVNRVSASWLFAFRLPRTDSGLTGPPFGHLFIHLFCPQTFAVCFWVGVELESTYQPCSPYALRKECFQQAHPVEFPTLCPESATLGRGVNLSGHLWSVPIMSSGDGFSRHLGVHS